MNVFIVHAHHEPKSFNGTLTRLAEQVLTENGHSVKISALYAMKFNPISDRSNFVSQKDSDYLKQQVEEMHATETDGFAPDIKAEMEKLFWCEQLIFQFPLWWFSMPAILKGWVDRVFAMGKAYEAGKWYDNGAFVGRRAMLSLTTGGPPTMYSPIGLNGDLNEILFPINHGIFCFSGFEVLPPFVAWGPAHVGEEERKQYLEQYKQRLLTLETTTPIRYPSLADYDPQTFQLKKG
jgi:NAD(P)H dehydrogenase (quinone)